MNGIQVDGRNGGLKYGKYTYLILAGFFTVWFALLGGILYWWEENVSRIEAAVQSITPSLSPMETIVVFVAIGVALIAIGYGLHFWTEKEGN